MMNTRKMVQAVCFSFIFISLIKISSFLKVHLIIGSHTGLFSGVNVMTPLAGLFGGLLGSLGVFSGLFGLRLLFSGIRSFHVLAFHVPGLCASLYWTTESVMIRLVLPLACMLLFIGHPVGSQAWLYSMYWLIPISLYFVPGKSFFFHALSSTFIAHAVGSVIWIYTLPMTSVIWLGLIPVVAVERLTFATGMVVAHRVIEFGINTRKNVFVLGDVKHLGN